MISSVEPLSQFDLSDISSEEEKYIPCLVHFNGGARLCVKRVPCIFSILAITVTTIAILYQHVINPLYPHQFVLFDYFPTL